MNKESIRRTAKLLADAYVRAQVEVLRKKGKYIEPEMFEEREVKMEKIVEITSEQVQNYIDDVRERKRTGKVLTETCNQCGFEFDADWGHDCDHGAFKRKEREVLNLKEKILDMRIAMEDAIGLVIDLQSELIDENNYGKLEKLKNIKGLLKAASSENKKDIDK